MNDKNNNMKNNAKQAFKELVSFSGSTQDEEDTSREAVLPTTEKSERKPLTNISMTRAEVKDTAPTSIIGADVIIEGNLSAEGSLEFAGKIDGDLQAKGTVIMTGEQVGNISCNELRLTHARITGEVKVTGTIEIDFETKITGNVFGEDVYISGCVKGNVSAQGLACLRESGDLKGDLQASRLSIEEGAKVDGCISIKTGNNPK